MKLPKEYKISVHRFIELTAQEGDLLSGFFSQKRGVDGTKGHAKVQASRGEGYRKEIPIKKEFRSGNFTLILEGRIDGCFETSKEFHLEEIKTVETAPPESWDDAPPLHRAQLICYAALWGTGGEISEETENTGNDQEDDPFRQNLSLDLTYYNLYNKEEITYTRNFSGNEIKEKFNSWLDNFFSGLEESDGWIEQRDRSAEKLEFPFANFRKGQRRFSVEVYRSLKEGEILLAQAPTGIGKTMGTLFPAVKAWGEGHIQRILYLTAKTTGRALAEQALESLKEAGLKFTSVTLTAKDKICPSPFSSRCNGTECLYARGFFDKLKEVNKIKRTQNLWRGEDFSRLGRAYEICPFELSMEWGLSADVLIGDFNHLFDPLVSLKRFFIREDRIAALIDEAHNLPDRAREMYSVTISKSKILACRRELGDDYPRLKKALSRINTIFLKISQQIKAEGNTEFGENVLFDPPQIEDLNNAFRRATDLLDEALRKEQNEKQQTQHSGNQQGESLRQILLELFFELRFYNSLREIIQGDSHKTWFSGGHGRKGNDCLLRLFCLDPAPFLSEAMEKCFSTVLFSATLTPLDYFERVLINKEETEIREDSENQQVLENQQISENQEISKNNKTGEVIIRKISIDSPFPPENNRVINRIDIDTRYKERENSLPKIISSIALLRRDYPGHQLVFFPSFAFMNRALEFWDSQIMGDYKAQSASMSAEERNNLLAHFDKDGKEEPQLIFAVLGGLFSEGIDLDGEKLSALSVVSIGLPSVSLERELIREYFDRKNNRGFDYAYRYPGWSRVLQACGRLIRTETDKGIIQLLGGRFNTPFYHNLFPKNWGRVRVVKRDPENRKEILDFKKILSEN